MARLAQIKELKQKAREMDRSHRNLMVAQTKFDTKLPTSIPPRKSAVRSSQNQFRDTFFHSLEPSAEQRIPQFQPKCEFIANNNQ